MSYTWKSIYHTLRAMRFVEKWIRDYLFATSHGDDMLDKQGALWNNCIDVV